MIENLRKPIGVACISEEFNEKILASALSANSQLQTIVTAIIATLLGYFADKFGIGYSIIISSLLLIIFIPFIMIKKELKKK